MVCGGVCLERNIENSAVWAVSELGLDEFTSAI